MVWHIKKVAKTALKSPVLVEGLPGIGNVGKIAVDFVIDALKAKKIYELFSYDLPHCVFINKHNLMELPSISIYQKDVRGRSVLFLAGDIQPISESSCYEFCNAVLDMFATKGLEVITLGGVALPRVPKEPRVYCTGNSRKYINVFPQDLVSTNIHGIVGPIIGVSGLLPGLAARRKVPAVALLAETYGHPNYLGIRGARNILRVLNKQLRLNIDISELDEEIEDVEKDLLMRQQNLEKITRVMKRKTPAFPVRADYIG